MRIVNSVNRPPEVRITVNGQELYVFPGENLATALFASHIYTLRFSPRAQQPRGAFCFMGVCQECLVLVNGQKMLACQTPVQAGQIVELNGRAQNR